MCRLLPHWQPGPSRQVLSLSQIHLPPGSFSRSNHQPNSDCFQVELSETTQTTETRCAAAFNPTLEAVLSQHLVTAVHPTI